MAVGTSDLMGVRRRRPRTATELARLVAEDPVVRERVKSDPVRTLNELAEPLERETFVYRIAAAGLALTALMGLVFLFVLRLQDKGTPDSFIAFVSAAVGAMAALMSVRGMRTHAGE